jgi:tRNA (guanine-N7-)-methyltransferase
MPVSELKVIPKGYPPLIEKIDWQEYFSDGKPPVALDIGCGRGAFLLEYSQLHTHENILGIELRKTPTQWVDGVIKGEQLPNCAILWYSVVNGLKFIEDSSISNIFYLFPDPWPKQKHRKRRAFDPDMLQEWIRILDDDGRLWLATDLKEVHDYHLKVLGGSNLVFSEIPHTANWGLPITNKEKFCIANDIEYYRVVAEKI